MRVLKDDNTMKIIGQLFGQFDNFVITHSLTHI